MFDRLWRAFVYKTKQKIRALCGVLINLLDALISVINIDYAENNKKINRQESTLIKNDGGRDGLFN